MDRLMCRDAGIASDDQLHAVVDERLEAFNVNAVTFLAPDTGCNR